MEDGAFEVGGSEAGYGPAVSNRRKRTGGGNHTGGGRSAPPSDILVVTAVRASEMASPDDEPMYALEIAGATLDALDNPGAPLDDPEKDVIRTYVLSREALHRLVAELHKAEGVA